MQNTLTVAPGKIIIINGPSSSGKTTLALALQKQLDLPFIRFSFDLFLDHCINRSMSHSEIGVSRTPKSDYAAR
jgi:chloramphenicol 3-O-phosphotransferase